MSEVPDSIRSRFYAANQLVGLKREDAQISLLWQYAETAEDRDRAGFLRSVLTDAAAVDLVRIEAMKAIAEYKSRMLEQEILAIGMELAGIAGAPGDRLVRLWAARQMQWFSEVGDVLAAARWMLADGNTSADLRIAALSTVERHGPEPVSIDLLTSLEPGSEVANYAERILRDWAQQHRLG